MQCDEKTKKKQELLDDLKYRVEITKRARIKASSRLRIKHLCIERIIY